MKLEQVLCKTQKVLVIVFMVACVVCVLGVGCVVWRVWGLVGEVRGVVGSVSVEAQGVLQEGRGALRETLREARDAAQEGREALRQVGGLAKSSRLVVAGAGRSLKKQEEHYEQLSRDSARITGEVAVGVREFREESLSVLREVKQASSAATGALVQTREFMGAVHHGFEEERLRMRPALDTMYGIIRSDLPVMTKSTAGTLGNLEKISGESVYIAQNTRDITAGMANWFKPAKTPFWRSILLGVGRELVPVGLRTLIPQRIEGSVQVVGPSTIRVESVPVRGTTGSVEKN